jgi:hypothetical protein
MKLRVVAVPFLLSAALAFSAHASPDAAATPTPGLMTKTLQFLHLKHGPRPAKAANPANIHGDIELKIALDPADVQLSNTRQVQVTVGLYNRSKKDFVHLDFPTSQRVEILTLDSTGKVINTWSEDQSFTNDPATITVNPGERVEYNASVPTRQMSAGQPYIIQVSFPNYPDLKIEQRIVPRG